MDQKKIELARVCIQCFEHIYRPCSMEYFVKAISNHPNINGCLKRAVNGFNMMIENELIWHLPGDVYHVNPELLLWNQKNKKNK